MADVKLIDPNDLTSWENEFRRPFLAGVPISRRMFLATGLAGLFVSTIGLQALHIELGRDALLIDFQGRRYRFAFNGFGPYANVRLARDGGDWIATIGQGRMPGLARPLDIALRIFSRRGEWRVAGHGAGSVPLTEWLDGLTPAPLARAVAIQPARGRFGIAASSADVLVLGSGAVLALGPMDVSVATHALAAQAVTWMHPASGNSEWHVSLEHAEVKQSTVAPVTLDRSTDLEMSLAGRGSAAVLAHLDGSKAGVLMWEGPVTAAVTSRRHRAELDIALAKAKVALRIGAGRPSLRLAARSDAVAGQGGMRGTGVQFAADPTGPDLTLEAHAGRASGLAFRAALTRAQVGIEDADLSDWQFPQTTMGISLGTKAPDDAALHLVNGSKYPDPEEPGSGEDGYHIGDDGIYFAVDASASLLEVFRSRDLLRLKFGFSNFYLRADEDAPSGARLVPFGTKLNPPLLIAHFEAQHIEENTYNLVAGEADELVIENLEELVEARAAGPTRVAFRIDETRPAFDLTLDQFTAWDDLALHVSGRAFRQDSDVFEQLDYVGIGEGIGRQRAMELIRASVEKDRVMDTASPDSRNHLTTAIEARYRMVVSASQEGTRVMSVATSPQEAELRGSQLWSARLVPNVPARDQETPVDILAAPDGAGRDQDDAQPQAVARDRASARARDLRVVWVRGVDLGFLHGRPSTGPDETLAPWSPRHGDEEKTEFNSAVPFHLYRDLMLMTSIAGLPAKRRLRATVADTGADATLAEIIAYFDSGGTGPLLNFSDDPKGQVVAPPPGFDYPTIDLNDTDTGQANNAEIVLRPEDVGIAVPRTLGPTQFILTPWGASIRSRTEMESFATVNTANAASNWGPSPSLELIHIDTHLGEDIFVAASQKGFLLPFGHRASYIQITRREFHPNHAHTPEADETDPTAYLIKRRYITVSKPTKAFPALGQPFGGRAGPGQKRIVLRTVQTTEIRAPESAEDGVVANIDGQVFWPRLRQFTGEGSDIAWEFELDDDAQSHRAPMLFVSNGVAQDPIEMKKVIEYYRALPADEQTRVVTSGGQRHSFAPAQDANGTAFATRSMVLSVSGRAQGAVRSDPNDPGAPVRAGAPAESFVIDGVMEGADQPAFYPTVQSARVKVQSVERMMGQSLGDVDVTYNRQWLEYAFAPEGNPSELFLDVRTRLPMDFSSDGTAAGGFATPNMDVAHLSRVTGPVGGVKTYSVPDANKVALANVEKAAGISPRAYSTPSPDSAAARGLYDPKQGLGGDIISGKFLGLVSLESMLATSDFGSGAPKMVEETSYGVESGAGGDVFDTLLNAVVAATGSLTEAVGDFRSSLGAALGDVLGSDGELDLEDLYPDLARALKRLEKAVKDLVALGGRLNESLNDIANNTPEGQAAREAARDRLGTAIGALTQSVTRVIKEVDKIIDNPVPAVVDEGIDDLHKAFAKLRNVITGDIGGLIKAAFDEVIDNILFAGLQAALPFADLVSDVFELRERAVEVIATLMGYARQTEAAARGEIARRVNEGLSQLPGQPNASPAEVDAYIDDILRNDVDVLAARINSDLRAYLSGQLDREAALLRRRAESILARQFAEPLAHLFQTARRVRQALLNDADEGRQIIVRELTQLVQDTTQLVYGSATLNRVTDVILDTQEKLDAFNSACEGAKAALTREGARLFGHFDKADAKLAALEARITGLNLPSKPQALWRARARTLQALDRAKETTTEGRFLVEGLTEVANSTTCLDIKLFEPAAELFRLQTTALGAVRDLSRGMADMIEEADRATSFAINDKAETSDDLATIKAAIEDGTSTIKDALKDLLGLSDTVDFTSVNAFKESLRSIDANLFKSYIDDVEAAVATAQSAAVSINSRIDAIDSPGAALPVLRDALAFAAGENKGIAALIAEVRTIGDTALAGLNGWATTGLGTLMALASPVWDEVALPVLKAIEGQLVEDGEPTLLGYFVKAEITDGVVKSREAVEAESRALTELGAVAKLDSDALSKLRDFVDEPLDLQGAVEVLVGLMDTLQAGQFKDIFTLDRLREDLENAILALLPVQQTVSFPWETTLRDFPEGRPIFEIITPSSPGGAERLNDPDSKYWLVEGVAGGKENVRARFYPELKGTTISAADFEKRRGDLLLDSTASFHFLTQEARFNADAVLHPFTINILPGFDVVKLHFRAGRFFAGTGQSSKLSVLPEDFELGPMVQFIAALSKYLSGGGEQGPYYEISLLPPKIEVGVRYNLPTIPLGPMIFSQISLNVSAELPLDDGELLFRAGVGRRSKPFLISVPPLGGGGFISISANDRIVGFEASMEYGAVVPLDFGLISGHGQITAGVYIAKTLGGSTVITGFLRAYGAGSIGMFGIVVNILMEMRHADGNMIGRVTVSFSFSVGFVRVNFRFSVEKRIAGSGSRAKSVAQFMQFQKDGKPWGRPLIRVQTPARMMKWADYNASYPQGLKKPPTVASVGG